MIEFFKIILYYIQNKCRLKLQQELELILIEEYKREKCCHVDYQGKI